MDSSGLSQASIIYDPVGPGEMIKEEPWSELNSLDTGNEQSPQYMDLSIVSIKEEVEDYVEVKEEVWNVINALGSYNNTVDRPIATVDSNRLSQYSSENHQELVFDIKEEINDDLIVVDHEEKTAMQLLSIANVEGASGTVPTARRPGLRNRLTMKSRISIKDGRISLIDDNDDDDNDDDDDDDDDDYNGNRIRKRSRVKTNIIKRGRISMIQNKDVHNSLINSKIALVGQQGRFIKNKGGTGVQSKATLKSKVKISDGYTSIDQNSVVESVKEEEEEMQSLPKEGHFDFAQEVDNQKFKDEDSSVSLKKTGRRRGPRPKVKICRYCGAGPFKESRSLVIHEYTHTGARPFTCEFCGLSYKDIRYLRIHKRVHTGERPYKCEYCPETFGRPHHLICHRRIHTGEKPYSCRYCNESFRVSYILKIHERKHTGEKPYLCEYCDASFKESGDLKVHRRTHTGERPFVCKICNRGFSQSPHLTEHLRLHTGERPYCCEQCKMTFHSRSLLIVHLRKHAGNRPYACEICGTAFYTIGGVKQHLRIHSAAGQYKCDICGGKFKRKNHLTLHRRSHIGELPYECELCGERFHLLYDFDIHKRSH